MKANYTDRSTGKILSLVVLCHAGYGALIIATEGAYRMDLSCKNVTVNNLRGEYLLQYKPQEPGIYLLNIKYGDDQIAGTTNSGVSLL